jgi:anti-sigma B factor antagonist
LIAGPASDSVAKVKGRLRVQINIRRAGSTTVFDLEGPLLLGAPQQELRQAVEEVVGNGTRRLAINLAGVSYMDSSGIGELVRTFTTLRKEGGRSVLFAPNKQVKMLLKMVRLDTVLDIAEDEAAALAGE